MVKRIAKASKVPVINTHREKTKRGMKVFKADMT